MAEEVFGRDEGPNGPWQVRIEHTWFDDSYQLFAWRETRDGKRHFAHGFRFGDTDPEDTFPRQAPRPLVVDYRENRQDNVRSFMQAVLDAAWELGLRPAGFKEHETELKATRYHLEDMRRLVFEEPKERFVVDTAPSVSTARHKT